MLRASRVLARPRSEVVNGRHFGDIPGEITAFRAAVHGWCDPRARDDFWRVAEYLADLPCTGACIDTMLLDLAQLGRRYEPSAVELDLIASAIAEDPLLAGIWSGRKRGRTPQSTAKWFSIELAERGIPQAFVTYATTQLVRKQASRRGT